MYTASTAFFEALWEAGATHCFVNLGSDHPSILEAIARGQTEANEKFPTIITCPNEMVALSAAHGMALITGRAQAVIVHVDVGTQGLAAAVHNASMGRVPVLIFAGLSPFTIENELRGSRTEFIHFIQDVHDQRAIVAQYCRYTAEIKTGRNIKQMIYRALSFAQSDPKGPVYLVGAREVMEEEIEPYYLDMTHWRPVGPGALPDAAVAEIGGALSRARRPLVITGYSGRNPECVPELVRLAELVGAMVLDTLGSDVCFPADHRAFLGVHYGVHDEITKADVILLLDVDTPYIMTRCKPAQDAQIFHIDVDPLKQQMPVFYVAAKSRYRADSATALRQLNSFLQDRGITIDDSRALRLEENLKLRNQRLELELTQRKDNLISTSCLAYTLKKMIPMDSVVLVEAVTLTGTVLDHLKPKIPGTMFNSGAGGLGWFGGAAIGVKLGLDLVQKGKPNFLVAIVGDGTFLFAVPASVYWVSGRYNLPFLTIVLNNDGWNAPRRSAQLVHPAGYTAKASNKELGLSFDPSPDYGGIARAAAGGKLWASQAATLDELDKVVREAVEVVKTGKSAVIDAFIVDRGF